MTTLTISQFFEQASDLIIYKFTNVTNAQKVRYVNRAILNRYQDIKALVPSVGQKNATLTATSDSQDLDLPTDIDLSPNNVILLYSESERISPLASDLWGIKEGKIRFYNEIKTGDIYYIEYTTEPNRYTAITDTMTETASVRAFELLQSEVEHIRDTDIAQGQVTGQSQASRVRANETS